MFLKRSKSKTKLLGIWYMLLCMFFFSLNDVIIKYILKFYSDIDFLGQVIFLRGVISTLIIGLYLYLKKQLSSEILFSKKLHLRGSLESLAAIFFFFALVFLPLGELYSLLNLAPVLITASGALFLREKVGLFRWFAVFLGFLGVLIVVNPQDLKFGYAFILPLISAIFIALRDTVTKKKLKSFNGLQIVFITSLSVTIWFGFGMIYKIQPIHFETMVLIFLSAIFVSIGYFFSVTTIQVSEISVTSPFRYTIIIWGLIFGYATFNEIPSSNMIIGSIIIVFSGLFILHREKLKGLIK
ncbi:MAG: DMT family transporter [Candidatus Fonsibacter sp.]